MFELIPCFVSSASVSRFKRAQVAFRAFSIEVSTILGEFVRFTLVFLGLCLVPHRALVLKLAKEAGAKFDLEPDVLAGKFLMERKELGSRRVDKLSLKERVARTVLRFVRAQGHPCVDLRKVKDNKKFIYYCTLCFAPCYGDSALFDHLKGKLHKKMCTAAELTLLKPNPWPFNDGLVFFDNSAEDEKFWRATTRVLGHWSPVRPEVLPQLNTGMTPNRLVLGMMHLTLLWKMTERTAIS